MFDLMKDDVKNFNKDDAITRVKANAPMIAGLIVGGKVVQHTKIIPKGLSPIVADLMMGAGVGTLAKAILDPPTVNPNLKKKNTKQIAPPSPNQICYDRPLYSDYARS